MKIPFNPLRDMLIAIVALSLFVYSLEKCKQTPAASDKLHQEYLRFDSADIKGKIDTILFRFNMEAIKVDNDKKEYLFDPAITSDGAYFHAVTEKGDSIIKAPLSKFVTIKGRDKAYTYTFKKF